MNIALMLALSHIGKLMPHDSVTHNNIPTAGYATVSSWGTPLRLTKR